MRPVFSEKSTISRIMAALSVMSITRQIFPLSVERNMPVGPPTRPCSVTARCQTGRPPTTVPEEGIKKNADAERRFEKAKPRRRQPNEVREGSKPGRWRQAKPLRSAGSIHESPIAARRETPTWCAYQHLWR